MCGIIGYVGRRDAAGTLLAALERLESRGYDSAGVCVLADGELHVTRAAGRLAALRDRMGEAPRATTGIGHTRWATHGPVTEANAHPLRAGPVAIALNGIVDNHRELRAELVAAGETLDSQTDAEVVAHLIRRAYDGSLVAAVRAAGALTRGDLAFVAVHADRPGLVVGLRRGAPLIAGLGDRETFLASSITAFADRARRVLLLEDGETVAITCDGARVLTPSGQERACEPLPMPETRRLDGHDGFETHMLKEIFEQPDAVEATLGANLTPGLLGAQPHMTLGMVDNRDLARYRRIVLVACGTAYHAALLGRLALETWADVPCEAHIASEWRTQRPRVDEHTLVIGVSQSGETADTLGAVRLARAHGAHTLAITNCPASQLTREVDTALFTHAGTEIGVAATKTFTTQVVLLELLAVRIAQLRGTLPRTELAALLRELRALPERIEHALAGADAVREAAESLAAEPFFLYLGRHAGLPVAREGALKLKEIAYVPTDAYAAGEMKHGPIALIAAGTPVVCVATASHTAGKLLSNLEEVRARGAHVLAVAGERDGAVRELAEQVFPVPRAHPLVQPALAVVPLQLFAYHAARSRGLDVDKPRNLAKTVTVE